MKNRIGEGLTGCTAARGVTIIAGVNRHFLAFLLFVGALVIAAGALAWWFSPQAALFFDADRRDQPAYVFDFSLQGGAARAVAASSRGTLMRVVLGEGGRFHYHGEIVLLLDGEFMVDEWQQVDIYSLPAGSDYLRLATHVDYLQLDGGPVSRQVLNTAYDPAVDLNYHANRSRVIWLLEQDDEATAGDQALQAFLATAIAHGATPAIRADVKQLAGGRRWNTLVAFEFGDERQALDWFRSLKTRNALAILKSRHVRTAGLLYRDVSI